MVPLHIRRRRKLGIDPKQALRTHVETLPLDQQQAFVVMALQLLRGRSDLHAVQKTDRYRQPHAARWQ